MTTDAHVRSVLLFFFLALLDEKAACDAAVITLQDLNSRLRKVSQPESVVHSLSVQCQWRQWKALGNRRNFGQPLVFSETEWLLPVGFDFGAWLEFRRQATDDEFLAVLWSQVIKFSDAEIAAGWGISEGAVRHRVGHGLRTLGASQAIRVPL